MSGRFSQNDLIVVTREIEVTPGVIVGGPRSRVYGTAPTFTPGGSSITSGINTGSGGVKSVRAGLRYADATVPSEEVFGLNRLEWEDVLRDSYPGSELQVSGSFTFSMTGTHVDGSTGPVITAAAGTFDDFVDADCEGLMMEITGAAINAANKWGRRIKAVKDDGTQIDIYPIYTGAPAGTFGENLVAQSGVSGTINLGRWVRNRGIQNIRTINLEWNYSDQPGGSFSVAAGLHGSGFKYALDGKGIITTEFMYVGMDFNDLSEVTIGNGTVNENPFLDNDSMVAGEDLAVMVINGTTVLSGDNLTSFSIDGNGNASGIDDTSGTRVRVGATVGDIDCTGSLKIYHKHAKSKVLTALSRAGNRVPIDIKTQDPAGNRVWTGLRKALFEPSAPKPGQKGGKTDGSWNYKTQLGEGTERTFVRQEFAKP